MSVSVVMPVFNSAAVVTDQLEALARQDFTGDWELVVADNGCTDSTLEIASAYADHLPLRFVDASARRGDVAARNIAVPDTNGDLIVFCDSDDAVGSDWLSGHVTQLGSTDVSIGPCDIHVKISGGDDGTYAAVPMHGTYGFLPYGLSANMGVRRDAFDAIGGFNENFRVGYDVEFCWRAQINKLRLGAVETAVVTKRKRGDTKGIWHQHKAFGIADVLLYTDYRSKGMPRLSARAFLTYGWLLAHALHLFDFERRLSWVAVAGQRFGRIIGTLRYRTLYL